MGIGRGHTTRVAVDGMYTELSLGNRNVGTIEQP
jgi:hypothetical protein